MIALDIIIWGILTGALYGLMAAGFNLQYGVARVLNIAHGEFIMLGAMATYSLYVAFGVNPLVSLAICAPIFFLVGILVHRVLLDPLRRSSGATEVFEGKSLLVTFGLLFVIQNVALLGWDASRRGYTFLATSVNIFGAIFAANRMVALAFAVSILLGFYFFLARTRLGKAIRAAAQDVTSAQLSGINIHWMYSLCFGFGALLAGLCGVLISTMGMVSPLMGFPYAIIAIIVVVLGGLGNILGSLAGGLILGIVGSVMQHTNPGLELVVFYVIFMIIILARPKGIFGK